MRSAFLGTPASAIPSLAALVDVADVDLVVTRPDRARGRSGRPMPPPVKLAAQEWGLAVAQPSTKAELLAVLQDHDLDLALVVAYGRILEPAALATTRLGFLNVHFSLLPRWRGAAPVERAIAAGDRVTGVSLMMLDEGLDTGPVLAAIETPIADDETGGTLTARLSYLGAKLVDDVLPSFMQGRVEPAPQLDAVATHAPTLTTAEARIDLTASTAEVLRSVRAFTPRPGAWLPVEGSRIKVLAAREAEGGPGQSGVIEVIGGVPVVATADGAIELVTVQPAGKRPLSGRDWANGRRGASAAIDPDGHGG